MKMAAKKKGLKRQRSGQSKKETSDRVLEKFISTDINGTIFQSVCPEPDPCDPSRKYRTFDGSCNNLLQPKIGWKNTPYQRVIPNAYFDGIEEIRKDTEGNDLPN